MGEGGGEEEAAAPSSVRDSHSFELTVTTHTALRDSLCYNQAQPRFYTVTASIAHGHSLNYISPYLH